MPSTSTASASESALSPNRHNFARNGSTTSDFESLRSQPFKRVLDALKQERTGGDTRTREELLVTYCRWLRGSGKIDEAWDIAEVLTTRVRGRIARTLAIWRLSFPPALAEELIEEIIIDFYNSLFDTAQSGEFWEARFWVAFDRNLLDIVRRRRKQLDHFPAFDQSESQADEESAPLHSIDRVHSMADPETATLVSEALLGLPEVVRTAYLLKHYGGFAEEAPGDGPTIASILGVSGRTVRNYMTKAEEHLTRWRDGVVMAVGGSNG